MRFEPEALHEANAGLNVARGLMEKIKNEFSWISYGDLWTLGGVAAVQVHLVFLACTNSSINGSRRKWLVLRFHGVPAELTVSPLTPPLTGVSQMLAKVLIILGM
jgi:hypothetical protein